MTLKQICNYANIEVPPYLIYMQNKELTNIALHRVFMRKGGALFLTAAYRGDALKKVLELARKTAVAVIFVTYEQYRECENKPDLVPCPLPGKIARNLSNKIRRDLNLKVIGITGSIGKTTTKDFIYTVVKSHFNTAKSIGNENTQYPILNNMQRMAKNTEVFVQEFGMGSPGTISYALDSCSPDIGVITNIKKAHINLYGSAENILKEKEKMVKKMPVGSPVILNYDDETLRNWKWDKYKVIWVSMNDVNADYYSADIVEENDYTFFKVISRKDVFKINLPVLGKHNINNALMAVAVGDLLGIPKEKIEKSFESYRPTGIRQNLVNIGGYKLYLDCYNNTAAEALMGSIEVLEKIEMKKGGKRIAIITDVNVGDADKALLLKMNKEAGEMISKAQKNIDVFYCFGDECARALYEKISETNKETYYSNDREELNAWIEKNIKVDDVTLYKGAFRRQLQRSVDQVYGTCFSTAASADDEFNEEYKYRIIDKTIHDREKMVSLMEYNGTNEVVAIPSEINGIKVFSVNSKCFANNQVIKKVIFNDNVTNVDNQAFINCKNLKEVVFSDNLKLIGNYAFKNCTNLIEVCCPESLIEIGASAFENCENLKLISTNSKLGKIGENAFSGCPKIKLKITKNEYVKAYIKANGIKKML